MKVLFVSPYHHPNSVIKSYIDGISPHCELVSGPENFWDSTMKFDIIHLQWPEELLGWHLYQKEDLLKLEKRLRYWKESGARIVITRHNSLPHREFAPDIALYDLCNKYADAVIHLGEFSLDEFKNHPVYSKKINVVINHPNYLDLPHSISMKAAKEKLGFAVDDMLYLSFGSIRHQKEQDELISAFKKIKVAKKKLLLTNSLFLKKIVSFRASPAKNFLYKFERSRLKKDDIIIDETRNISIDSIQDYYNAAEIVVIPRVDQLNSGLLYLAFSFSKIVVGPDISNIGPLLKKTGNMVYTPGDTQSFVAALEKASTAPKAIGAANFRYAVDECGVDKIGREHFALYEKLTGKDS